MGNKSTQERVIEDYFRLTSDPSISVATWATGVSALGRRLGSWLDVSDKDILELGSGLGETCRLCFDRGARTVTGVNLSQGEIDFARQRVHAHFVKQDVLEFLRSSPSSVFDCIFALNILEHLDTDSLAGVLDQALRVLRPGGVLVAMVPNATSPFGCMTRYWDITHYSAFTPSSFTQLAKLSGFVAKVEFRECGPVPHGLVSAIRWALWQLIRIGIKFRLMVEVANTKGGVYTADMMVRLTKSRDSDTTS